MRMLEYYSTGVAVAIMGAMLSYGKTSFEDFTTAPFRPELLDRVEPLAFKLVRSGAGHDKFMEQIIHYLVIEAPRYWWSQFDTYRVGTSKSSESTMHTLMKKPLTQSNFQLPIGDAALANLNDLIASKKFNEAKNALPEGFLQTRLVVTNAKTLRNMYLQRKDHRLEEWKYFCDFFKSSPSLVHRLITYTGEDNGNLQT